MWLILLTFAGVAFDQTSDNFILGVALLFMVVTYVTQSDIVRHYLTSEHSITLEAAKRPRIGALFILSLIFTFAVIFGLLLLILPGIYLAARWWAAVSVMYATETNATEALALSWEKSANHVPAISLALVILQIPAILSITLFYFVMDDMSTMPLLMSLVENVLASVSQILTWISGGVTYMLLGARNIRVTNIFD